jgi:hypothetical protein
MSEGVTPYPTRSQADAQMNIYLLCGSKVHRRERTREDQQPIAVAVQAAFAFTLAFNAAAALLHLIISPPLVSPRDVVRTFARFVYLVLVELCALSLCSRMSNKNKAIIVLIDRLGILFFGYKYAELCASCMVELFFCTLRDFLDSRLCS